MVAAIIAVTVIADQLTKQAARSALLHGGPREYLGGIVSLLYAENSGAFLSLGASLPPTVRSFIFSALVAAGLLAALWVVLTGRVESRLDTVALALIIGGGIGNLIDRLRFAGRVTDFLYFAVGPLHTGVFNVADMAITGGVIWLAISWFRPRRLS